MDYLALREKVIKHHQMLEYAPQSPFNPKNLGLDVTPYSERPISFICDDEVLVVGPCVGKITKALFAFQTVMSDPRQWEAISGPNPVVALYARMKIEKFLALDRCEEIRVPQQVWGAYLFGLNYVGCDVIQTDERSWANA